MKPIAVFTLAALILAAACGGGGETSEAADSPMQGDTAAENIRTLTITDSIGVDLGDSNYVFGSVENVCFGPDANLYVFDRVKGSAMVYDQQGRFVRRISRRGQGPGEMSYPLAMTVLDDGRVMITSIGGIHSFSPTGEYQGVFAEYYNNPPMNLLAVGDSSLAAIKLTVAPGEDGNAMVDFWVAKFTDEGEPGVIYATDSFTFDPTALTEMLQRTFLAYDVAGDPEGRLYVAPRSSELFQIDIYDEDGQLIRTIQDDYPQVAKSEEEIREEKAWMELYLENMGVNGVVIEFDPDPMRRMISDLGVDSQHRIWARRGTSLRPVFEVYSLEGEHLFTAQLEGVGDEGQFWQFAIEGEGMAAFSTNPEYYQQVYLMELEEG